MDGKRAYALAREGKEVTLKARQVTVHSLTVGHSVAGQGFIDVELVVECSSGTYIRALARDIGAVLGVGGNLVAMTRDRIGPFSVESAPRAEDLTEASLLSLAEVARKIMPVVKVDVDEADDLRHGRAVDAESWPADQPLAALEEE